MFWHISLQTRCLKRQTLGLPSFTATLVSVVLPVHNGQEFLGKKRFRDILELEGTSALSHFWLGQAYLHRREYQEAIQALQRSRTVPKYSRRARAYIAYAHALAGNRAEAQRTLDELNALSKERYVAPYLKALIYAGLGDIGQAFRWLERAYDERDLLLVHLRVSPLSDALRSDSRFQDLLHRMNLPPAG